MRVSKNDELPNLSLCDNEAIGKKYLLYIVLICLLIFNFICSI